MAKKKERTPVPTYATVTVASLGAALMSASKEFDRDSIRSVHISPKHVVATDGYMIVRTERPTNLNGEKPPSITIPRDFVEQVYVLGNRLKADRVRFEEPDANMQGSTISAAVLDRVGVEIASLSHTRPFDQTDFPNYSNAIPNASALADMRVVRIDGRLLDIAIAAMRKCGAGSFDLYVDSDPLAPVVLASFDSEFETTAVVMPKRR